MAKSDMFFIRAEVNQPGASYQQQEIDLGAYVNLGVAKSTLLRVHAIEWMISDDNAPMSGPSEAGAIMNIGNQITTQEQTALVTLADKSLIASQRYEVARTSTAGSLFITDTRDVGPQSWEKGYLVGVDTLFLGTASDQAPGSGAYTVSCVLQCSLETATQSNAVALALSQQ